jgi:hypothetical protein
MPKSRMRLRRAILFGFAVGIATTATRGNANTCAAPKRINTKHVCGIVLDGSTGSDRALQAVPVRMVSPDGRTLSTVFTDQTGQFSLSDVPSGESFIDISAPRYYEMKWPMLVKGSHKTTKCTKPLKVYMIPDTETWACGGGVFTK